MQGSDMRGSDMHGSELSAVGRQRRDAIRASLIAGMRSRQRRSRVLQVALLVSAAVLIAVRSGSRSAANRVPGAATPRGPTAVERDLVRIAIDRDDPAIVRRLRIEPAPSQVRVLQDDDLLAALRHDGRPGGVIRIGGRLEVVGVVPDDWQ